MNLFLFTLGSKQAAGKASGLWTKMLTEGTHQLPGVCGKASVTALGHSWHRSALQQCVKCFQYNCETRSPKIPPHPKRQLAKCSRAFHLTQPYSHFLCLKQLGHVMQCKGFHVGLMMQKASRASVRAPKHTILL